MKGAVNGLPLPAKIVLWIALAALAYAFPLLELPLISTPDSDFASVLFTVTIYCLVALGLNIVVGYAGLLDLGYVGFYAIGAYTVAILTSFHGNWPLLLAIPVAVVIAMISGIILGVPTLRVRGDYLAIVTLGFGEIIRLVVVNTEWLGASKGINNIGRPPNLGEPDGWFQIPHLFWGNGTVLLDTNNQTKFLVFGFSDAVPFYWLGLTAVILVLIADILIKSSRVGRAWEATREDEDAAELMGVPTFKFKLLAFSTGAFVGGLAGALFASRQSFINPLSFLLLFSILYLAAVVVGGQGNRWGVLVGAFLVAYLPERFRGFEDFRVLAFGLALVLLATLRPQGLLPPRRTVRARPLPIPPEAEEAEAEAGADAEHEAEEVPKAPERVLEVDALTLKFGGLTALDEVSFHIDEGEILGLIGPNGAGKTTCFNAITSVYQPTSGDIRFRGRSIVGLKQHMITQAGIARTFQNIRLFPSMTAYENVLVGADAQHRTGMLGALFRMPWHSQEEAAGNRRAIELLEFMGIADKANEIASNLSYGDQRRLEIARAMATGPKLICLDEPAAGFNPKEKVVLMDLIKRVRDEGYTVLLIEHDMRLVMGVTDRIVVLEFGRKIAEGSPEDIRNDPAVIAAYLGVEEQDAS